MHGLFLPVDKTMHAKSGKIVTTVHDPTQDYIHFTVKLTLTTLKQLTIHRTLQYLAICC